MSRNAVVSSLWLRWLIVWGGSLLGCFPALAQEGSRVAISPALVETLRQDVSYLASDELKGRSVTDETIREAADYVASRMREIGLQVDQVEGKPFQPVSISIGSQINEPEKNRCRFDLPGGVELAAELNEGFGPLAVGADQGEASGRVVFAGYGISSETHRYDDYDGIDADGAIVMILRKEPGMSDPDSPFDGVKNTRHAYFATKIANAIAHGAIGVLLINDPNSTREAAQTVRNRIKQEERRLASMGELRNKLPPEAAKNRKAADDKIKRIRQLMKTMEVELADADRGVLGITEAGTKTPQSAKIPVASIARDLANDLLRAAGAPGLEAIEETIDETFQPASESLDGVSADLSVDLKRSSVTSDNVIGVLPGKGELAEEYVVVGAHYDHVGMGGYGSLAPGTIAVHNGADDNASGTASLLNTAALLRQRLESVDSHREILFIAFTGEERGLVGSQHYVSNPLRPIERTAAMINLDMVGRMRDNELTVYGTGTAAGMGQLVDDVNRRFGFDLYKVASGYGPSDHQSFYRAGVPVLFFFTGLHNDYHRPSDDIERIEFDALARVTDIVAESAEQLAVKPDRLKYAETNERVEIRRQMTAFIGIRLNQRPGFVQVSEVTSGSPAEAAGIEVGDRIDSLGKTEIETTADVLQWVRRRSPGDAFLAKLRREGSKLEVRGKLGKRSGK
jgi:acetylornithine deacetylase/succinyl-diaminopimelate desuccinylase-like protein